MLLKIQMVVLLLFPGGIWMAEKVGGDLTIIHVVKHTRQSLILDF